MGRKEGVQVDSSRGSEKKQAFPGAQAPRCGGRGKQECCLLSRHPPSVRPPPPHALQPQLGSGAPGWLSLRSTCQTEPAPCLAVVTPRLRAPCWTPSSSLTLLDSAWASQVGGASGRAPSDGPSLWRGVIPTMLRRTPGLGRNPSKYDFQWQTSLDQPRPAESSLD